MRKIICLALILLLLCPLTALNKEAKANEIEIINSYDKGYRYNIQGFVYLHIEGDPYERGYQYGYLASDEIIDMIQRWQDFASPIEILKIKKIEDEEKCWSFYKEKALKFFYNQVPKEYIDEMKGITDAIKDKGKKINGREIEFKDIFTSQFVQDVYYRRFHYQKKGFHPLTTLIYRLKQLLSTDLSSKKEGHCNAFIATGDATKDGGIVVAHATVFRQYIAERCNLILDVKPSNGYRFTMTCPPGSIWSQEDWYQNEEGIVLTETELYPGGPWVRMGKPKGVRSRTAIQYSKSIDEVIKYLKDGNNGLIPNEWLIGDTKTGEIASFQQMLLNTPIKKTKNGFFWSCCVAHDLSVLSEQTRIPKFLLRLASKMFPKMIPFKVDGNKIIWETDVPVKFEELKDEFYGRIDTEIAKKMMSTHPLTYGTTDCKITGSKLMDNLGLTAFLGISNGKEWIPDKIILDRHPCATILPPSGWVELYPSISKQEDNIDNLQTNKLSDRESNSIKLWKFDTKDTGNTNYSSVVVSDNMIYTSTSNGAVYALNKNSKRKKWEVNIAEKAVEPVLSEELLFCGTNKGLHTIDIENGNIVWEKNIGLVSSKPVLMENYVIAGCSNGEINIFDYKSEELVWSYALSDPVYISDINSGDIIYVGSGEKCYALDIKNHKKLWEYKTNGIITSSPRKNKNTVYVGSWDGKIHALNSKTGEVKWNYETGWGIDSTPAVSNNVVFVGSLDNNFYAINAENGFPLWYYKCKSAIHSNPVTYGEYVFFGCDDGRLYALNQKNGELSWSFAPKYFIKEGDVNNYITTSILSNTYIEDGVVYLGADGAIYALDAQTVEKDIPENINKKTDGFSFDIILILVFLVIVILTVFFISKKRKKR